MQAKRLHHKGATVMTNGQLPGDLQRLERRLAQRPREEPPAALHGRVIASVEAALRRQPSGGGWRMLAAAAAAVLIWLNLSLSATNATDGPLRPRGTREPVERIARQIEQLLPDLPREEARRHAVLYQSGCELVPCPQVSARPLSDPTLAGPPGW
jgi:hypothetical protein